METTPFEHSPLNPADPRAIQILDLLPSRDLEGPVYCELRCSSLDKDIKYEAVSYTWGDPQPGHTVFINGSYTLDVTPNCLGALKSFRGKYLRRTLWVDAICIDQRDTDTSRRERDRQVRIMGDVYRKAQKVLAWLGPEEATTAQTISKLKRVANRENVAYYTGISILSTMPAVDLLQFPDDTPDGQYDTEPKYRALASLILSPWAQRVWTLQEQILARKCEAYQGRQSLPMDYVQGQHLEHTIDMLTGGDGGVVHVLRNFIYLACQRYDAGKSGSQQSSKTIGKALLDGVFDLQAKQPIDRIYGLYSLLTSYCKLPIAAPDYTKTAEQVFEETAWAWIDYHQDLSILKLAARPESVRDLASWVPAWHRKHPRFAREIRYGLNESARYFQEKAFFGWNYSHADILSSSGKKGDESTETATPGPALVARLLSPGRLCVLGARLVGRVTRAVGPGPDPYEFLIRHLDWARLFRGIRFRSAEEREEALHEMFRSVAIPGPYNNSPERTEELRKEIFESFRGWFGFVSHLAEASELSNSKSLGESDAEDTHDDHDQETLKYYRRVLDFDWDKAVDVLENGYDGEFQGLGREGLRKLAGDVRETRGKLLDMRNHSLCLLNDNMLAVTDYWCQEGDEVFIFPGSESPFVIRKVPNEDSYCLIGPILIDRLLRVGYQEWRSEGTDLQDILLI